MKLPRTIRILRLMTSVVFSVLHNEPILLRGNLAKLDELGGIYIKFLQIVVLNMNTGNQKNFLEMLAVYEKSKPDNINVHSHLRKLGILQNNRISNLEGSPIGTGSFGQVYRATLDGHRPVIIKVLRPSVMRYIRYDLRLLSFLSYFYSLADRQKMLNFRDIYAEFKRTCEQEIDYVREAEVAAMFYRQYQNHPQMVIPKTYLELCTPHLIVQDYVTGVSLTDLYVHQSHGLNARDYVYQQLGSDLFAQLHIVGYELLAKALKGELIHADPHPGNIILLPQNKVALIDFGMTTQLQTNRYAFLSLIKQYESFYNKEAPTQIDDLLVAALRFMSPKLYAAMSSADELILGYKLSSDDLIKRLRLGALKATQDVSTQIMIQGLLRQNRIMKALFFAVNKGNRFGLTVDLQAIILLKATHGYLSLIGPLDPECGTLARVLTDVVNYAEANLEIVIDNEPTEVSPAEALEILSNWLDKMSRNDPYLMQEIAGSYL